MGAHKTCRLVIYLLCALHSEMDLIVTELLIDIVNSLHKTFLTRFLFRLIRRKQVQLHAIGTL